MIILLLPQTSGRDIKYFVPKKKALNTFKL